jgi:23S rRNA (guanine2445-N2)-methyltransferase / 23S rRNA (guanine2069-N7)-methyltransferase
LTGNIITSGASSHLPLFITCPKGLENLLVDELDVLGGQEITQTVAGVRVRGDLYFAYSCCMWSRLANKVLVSLGQVHADNADSLYQGVSGLEWSRHIGPGSTLWVELSGTNNALRNTQYSAQVVKDAIVDQLRTVDGDRPSINRENPDLTVSIRLHRDKAAINLDLCGYSLHKRGYRGQSVVAPLKENLAAALLIRAGWPQAAALGWPLIDPMCGSGTLLLEAAMMASDMAPGLWREQFAFERWRQHQPQVWEEIKLEALRRHRQGLAKPLPEIRGYDEDWRAVRASQANAESVGFDKHIHVMQKPLADFKRPSHGNFDRGLLITNPPYGERLGAQKSLLPIYEQLGDTLRQDFAGWQAAVFTGAPSLGKALGLRSHKRYKLFNGAIASELLLFDIYPTPGSGANTSPNEPLKDAQSGIREIVNRGVNKDITRGQGGGGDQSPGIDSSTLAPGVQMVANRLQKNLRRLRPWAEKRGIDCYRLYDADLPEYAAAIDLYGKAVHVQEYEAPQTVDRSKAKQRIMELVQAVTLVLAVDNQALSLKQRQRNRGKQQYQRIEDKAAEKFDIVHEQKAKFAVNIWTYLDTGLFLDHRIVRDKLSQLAKGKRLLNLFCYTATATVQAVLAGAKSSVNVDMSRTYLQWAQRNFDLNNIGKNHQLVQADCFQWLKECREGFDIIFLDPPSFSNSKRMKDVLDVQRDHVSLIKRCLDLLSPRGTLIFSTNLRRFQLDYSALSNFKVEDISLATIDKDFQRNKKIHQCFLINHK